MERDAQAGSPNLVYVFEDSYQKGFKIADLQGQDRLRLDYLKAVCPDSRIYFYFAELSRAKTKICYDYDNDGYGTFLDCDRVKSPHIPDTYGDTAFSSRLKAMFDANNGQLLAQNVTIDDHDIINAPAMVDEPSGSRETEGSDDWHEVSQVRRSCILLVPQCRRLDVLYNNVLTGNVDLSAWMSVLLHEVNDPSIRDRTSSRVEELSNFVISHHMAFYNNLRRRPRNSRSISNGYQFTEDIMNSILEAALKLELSKLFEKAASMVKQPLSMGLNETLGQLSKERKWDEWQQGWVVL